jgi:hypothetical protein
MDDLVGAAQGALIKFSENNKCWLALHTHNDAMSTTEAVPISGFEITYGRGLEASKVQNGAAYLAEPGEEEFPDIRVKLDFPKNDAGGTATDNTLFFDDFQDGTAWQLQMEFTGGIIGATAHHYTLKLFFPKLLVAAVPDTKKAGMVKTSVEFIAVASTAAVPVGMVDSLFPYITIINTRATSYLA